MGASKNHVNNVIEFPLISIPAGSTVYFIKNLDENISEVFFDGSEVFNGPGVGNIFIWRDFLSDTVKQRIKNNENINPTKIPSLY